MTNNYDSFTYWEELISENKTIRGQMFMDTLPNERTIYIHSLVFCKNNGINNSWTYFPDEKALLGYIQYSFLQESFYKWIYGKERIIVNVPNVTVEKIISDGEINNKITKEEANNMRRHVNMIKACWNLPRDKVIKSLLRFARDFNRTWFGDNREFLYLKIFTSSEELGEFVLNSNYITRRNKNEIEPGLTTEEWQEICKKAEHDEVYGIRFKNILQKALTEII